MERLTTGTRVVSNLSRRDDATLALLSGTTTEAAEAYALETGALRRLTRENDALFGELQLGTTEDLTSVAPLTLHVGHGTFRPVRTRDIREHRLGYEEYDLSPETAGAIKRSKSEGRRIVAVGTTVVKTLERAGPKGGLKSGRGKTDLLITPGYSFKVVDALITNFHLPRSSLLFLVSAFAGLDLIKEAYRTAIAKAYRFYSYGDAMLIL